MAAQDIELRDNGTNPQDISLSGGAPTRSFGSISG